MQSWHQSLFALSEWSLAFPLLCLPFALLPLIPPCLHHPCCSSLCFSLPTAILLWQSDPSLPPVETKTNWQKKWASHIRQGTRSVAAFLFVPGFLLFGEHDVVLAVAVNCPLLSLLMLQAPLGILLPPGAQQGQQLPRPEPRLSYKEAAEGMAPAGQWGQVWGRCSLEAARHNLGSIRWRWLHGHRGSPRDAHPCHQLSSTSEPCAWALGFLTIIYFSRSPVPAPHPCHRDEALGFSECAQRARSALAASLRRTRRSLLIPHFTPDIHKGPSSSHPASPVGCPGTPRAVAEGAPGAAYPSAISSRSSGAAGRGSRRWAMLRGCSAASAGLRKCGRHLPGRGPSPPGPALAAPERPGPRGRPPPSAAAARAPPAPSGAPRTANTLVYGQNDSHFPLL